MQEFFKVDPHNKTSIAELCEMISTKFTKRELEDMQFSEMLSSDVSYGLRGTTQDFSEKEDYLRENPNQTTHEIVMRNIRRMRNSITNVNEKRQVTMQKPKFLNYENDTEMQVDVRVLHLIKGPDYVVTPNMISQIPIDPAETYLADALLYQTFYCIQTKNKEIAMMMNRLDCPNFLYNYCAHEGWLLSEYKSKSLENMKNVDLNPILLQLIIALYYLERLDIHYTSLSLKDIRIVHYNNGINLGYLFDNKIITFRAPYMIKLACTKNTIKMPKNQNGYKSTVAIVKSVISAMDKDMLSDCDNVIAMISGLKTGGDLEEYRLFTGKVMRN
jgi:hypothetical protein